MASRIRIHSPVGKSHVPIVHSSLVAKKQKQQPTNAPKLDCPDPKFNFDLSKIPVSSPHRSSQPSPKINPKLGDNKSGEKERETEPKNCETTIQTFNPSSSGQPQEADETKKQRQQPELRAKSETQQPKADVFAEIKRLSRYNFDLTKIPISAPNSPPLKSKQNFDHPSPDRVQQPIDGKRERSLQGVPDQSPLNISPLELQQLTSEESNTTNFTVQSKAKNEQATNVFGEKNYVRISNAQQKLIDDFSVNAHSAIAPWGELRALHTLAGSDISYDDYFKGVKKIQKDLKHLYDKLSKNFTNADTSFTKETSLPIAILITAHKHRVSLQRHVLAQKEIARQLNQGFFPQYFKEMQTLHGNSGINVISMELIMIQYGGLKISSSRHIYQLKTIFGVEGSAGPPSSIVSGGGFIKAFQIEYQNDLGMSWKVNTYGGAGKIGAGGSLSPVEGNIESSLGNDKVNAGTATEYKYYPPNYFNWNFVSATSVGAGVGGGYSIGKISFGDVDFDTQGLTVKVGTNAVGEAGVDIGLGLFKGGDVYDKKGLKKARKHQLQSRGSQWIPVIATKVYFKTEEAALDKDDQASLDKVVEAILRHEQFYPGDIFKISVKGFASEVWKNPEASIKKYGVDTSEIDEKKGISSTEKRKNKKHLLNELLAKTRAKIVNQELVSKIFTHQDKFTPGVLDQSQAFSDQYEVIYTDSPEHDQNAPTNRYVLIGVFYNDSPEGNVKYKKAVEK